MVGFSLATFRKRGVIFVLCVLTVCGVLFTQMPLDGLALGGASWEEKRGCYQTEAPENDLIKQLLPNILEDPVQPRPGRDIFFHETSCSMDYRIALSAR